MLRQAIATGLVWGGAWGALEALVHWARLSGVSWDQPLGTARLVPTEPLSVLALGALVYALVSAALLVVATPLAAPVLGRGEARAVTAPRALVTIVVAANLFWWTKPLWDFTYGLPFHHPKRLAIDVVWLAIGAGVAWLVVRPRSRWAVPRGPGLALALLVLAAAGGWAWQREARITGFADRPPPPGDPPNVLWVVVDALRADRLGCYGYDERDPPISPNVDAMAEEGVVFERTVAQAPFTWTSFGSFLTGKYPRKHGLMKMDPRLRFDPRKNRTIAQALQEEGYVCGAFLTGTLSNNSGLLTGFDTYFEAIVGHEPVTRASKWSIVRAEMLLVRLYNKVRQALDPRLVNTEARSWMRRVADRPFLAMVHYYSTHTPYGPPSPYDRDYDPDYDGIYHPFYQSHGVAIGRGDLEFDERDLEHVEALYDGGVRFADEMFGALLDELEALGVDDETLVIFTSDHGEELYDHGVFEHDWMFNTNLYVPLVMRLPGREFAGTRVEHVVEMIDLPPTVIDVVGVGTLVDRAGDGSGTEVVPDGRSLLPDLRGAALAEDERWAFSENNRYVAMQGERYKIVVSRDPSYPPRIYDLHEDPGEYELVEDAAIRAALEERMEAYEATMPSLEEVMRFGDEDAELGARLRELGYLGGEMNLGPNERREEDVATGAAPGAPGGEDEEEQEAPPSDGETP